MGTRAAWAGMVGAHFLANLVGSYKIIDLHGIQELQFQNVSTISAKPKCWGSTLVSRGTAVQPANEKVQGQRVSWIKS